MYKLAILIISFIFCFQAYSANVKSLDFNPEDTNEPNYTHSEIELNDKLIFMTHFEEGFKLWRQVKGSEKIEEYFDGTARYLSVKKVLRWDNDKIIFYSKRNNKENNAWFQTDGTEVNTYEFNALNGLDEEYPIISGTIDVLFVTSIDNENILIFVKGDLRSFGGGRRLTPIKYNTSSASYEITGIIDDDVFSFSPDSTIRFGNYIFLEYGNGGLYRLNILDMHIDELVPAVENSNYSFWFQYANSAADKKQFFQTTSSVILYVTPLFDTGFYQTYLDGIFSLHEIDGETGEIHTFPIESEVNFTKNVLQNSKSLYVGVGGSDHLSEKLLFKVDKGDFSYQQIDIQTSKPEQCFSSDVYSHQAEMVTENGVLVKASFICNYVNEQGYRWLDNLSFVNELSGVVQPFNDGNNTLPYSMGLQATSLHFAFYHASNRFEDESEIWELNLENMEFNRTLIPKNSKGITLSFTSGYAMGDKYYFYVNKNERVKNTPNNVDIYNWSPTLTYKINRDTGTVDPFHHFSKNVRSTNKYKGEFIETSEGVFLMKEEWVDNSPVMRLYKFESTYSLSLHAEVNIKELAHPNKLHFFASPSSDLIYFLTKKSESEHYFLNSVDSKSSEITNNIVELANNERNSGPDLVVKIEDGFVFLSYPRSGFLKVDINNGSQIQYKALPYNCEDYDFVSQSGVFDLSGVLVKEISGKTMTTEDGHVVIYEDYYLTGTNDLEAKISVLNCLNLELTELMRFSTVDRVFDGGMFLGLDNWIYITDGGAKNHRVKASDLAIEEYNLESTRDIHGETPSGLYQNENGLFRLFYNNMYDEGSKEIATTVEKYSGEEATTVASSTNWLVPYWFNQPDGSDKVYAIRPTEYQDVMYFDMVTESFVGIEIIPGQGSLGHLVNESFYWIASNGLIYLQSGVLGADLTIVNTNCNDFEKCDFPFGSSPPTVVNHNNYDFTAKQAIYIPIRAKDPDSDITSYKLINAPTWLRIENEVIVGRVPNIIESDIEGIILRVEDSMSSFTEHYFSLSYVPNKKLKEQDESLDTDKDGIGNNEDSDDDNDGVDDSVDVFPLDGSESLDTDNDGIGNNADTDDDNDAINDLLDAFPLDGSESLDTDNDGIGNNADSDDDNDGVADSIDAFPLDSSKSSNSNISQPNNVISDSNSGGGGAISTLLVLLAYLIYRRRITKQ